MSTDPERKDNPMVVMAVGGFLGGLVAGGNNAEGLGVIALSLIGSYVLLAITGQIEEGRRGNAVAVILGLSTVVSCPCGFIGWAIGRALWGGH